MGLFSGIKKTVKKTVGGIGKHIKHTIKQVKRAANYVRNKVGAITNKLGPVGTIGLIIAMPYIAQWATTTFGTIGATAATGEGALGTLAAGEATASASASVASGAMSISEGVTQASMLAEQTAAFGAAGEAATYEALGMGAEQASMLAAQTAEFGAAGTEATISAAETAAPSAGLDWGSALKAGAKSLLSGAAEQPSMEMPMTPSATMPKAEAIKSVTGGAGGGLGFSQYTEQLQPTLTGRARQQEETYKSLLARGY